MGREDAWALEGRTGGGQCGDGCIKTERLLVAWSRFTALNNMHFSVDFPLFSEAGAEHLGRGTDFAIVGSGVYARDVETCVMPRE